MGKLQTGERKKKERLFSVGVLLLNYGHYASEEVLKSRGVAYYYTAASSVSFSLLCPPSQNLKIGLGLDSIFPFLSTYIVLRIGPWDVLVKDILCQHLVIRHMPVLSDSRNMFSLPLYLPSPTLLE